MCVYVCVHVYSYSACVQQYVRDFKEVPIFSVCTYAT